MNTDPMLPEDGDYPTGPIDYFDENHPDVKRLIASRTVVDEQGNMHDVRGRFTFKDKPVGPSYTYEDTLTWALGPDTAAPHITVMDWPDNPDYDDAESLFGGAVVVCRPKASQSYRIAPTEQKRPANIKPDASTIRAWAGRNGLTVASSGRIPQRVMDAYLNRAQ